MTKDELYSIAEDAYQAWAEGRGIEFDFERCQFWKEGWIEGNNTLVEDEESISRPHENDALTAQVGGDHYKNFKIQPVEFIHANGLDFFQGNVVKYIARFRSKNGKQDLLKARHYIDLLLQLEYPDNDSN